MSKLFKGGNYSREESINHLEVLTAETIQRGKLFKGGNYMRKYGMRALSKDPLYHLIFVMKIVLYLP